MHVGALDARLSAASLNLEFFETGAGARAVLHRFPALQPVSSPPCVLQPLPVVQTKSSEETSLPTYNLQQVVRVSMRFAHGAAATLLFVGLIPAFTRAIALTLLLTPCVWLVPALYHLLFLHAGSTANSNVCGIMYVVLLPACLSYMTARGDNVATELPLAAFTTSSGLCFYSHAQNHTAVLIMATGASAVMAPAVIHADPVALTVVLNALLAVVLLTVAAVPPGDLHDVKRVVDILM